VTEQIGFIGLGVMGRPMSLNLIRARVPLVVWSRTGANCDEACAAGAKRAASVADVFARCRVVLLMLATEEAIDAVLDRGSAPFRGLVRDHVVVHMGTTSPEYSAALAAGVHAAGGEYVEAPVSGSRVPAENAELVAMVAGAPSAIETVRPVLAPMCRQIVECGVVPGALTMKLAVNLHLVTAVASLAEAANFAARRGLDAAKFVEIVDGGQLASPIARIKAAKLRDRNFEVQAAIHDVRKNSRLATDAARAAGIATPLAVAADQLYAETVELGFGHEDMAAVVRALEARSADVAPAAGQ
jgi:3-hydroxyisobutyrate dehydrogenase